MEAGFSPTTRQQIVGLAVNPDQGNWLVRGEFIHINRTGGNYKDFARIPGVGYRRGKWQPRYGAPRLLTLAYDRIF